jgi:hypothetical protein
MSHPYTEQDPRVRATSGIWGIAVGMLGVCIPLVAITNSGLILPILVIVAAGISTTAIWLSQKKTRENSIPQLPQKLAALEERVNNLEMICSSVDWDLQPRTLPDQRPESS